MSQSKPSNTEPSKDSEVSDFLKPNRTKQAESPLRSEPRPEAAPGARRIPLSSQNSKLATNQAGSSNNTSTVPRNAKSSSSVGDSLSTDSTQQNPQSNTQNSATDSKTDKNQGNLSGKQGQQRFVGSTGATAKSSSSPVDSPSQGSPNVQRSFNSPSRVRNAIERINSIQERPPSPSKVRSPSTERAQPSVFRTTGSIPPTIVPKSPVSQKSPESSPKYKRDTPIQQIRDEPNRLSNASQDSSGGFQADIDTAPGSTDIQYTPNNNNKKEGFRIKVSTTHISSSKKLEPSTETEDWETDSSLDNLELSDSDAEFNGDMKESKSKQEEEVILPVYRPPIVDPSTSQHHSTKSSNHSQSHNQNTNTQPIDLLIPRLSSRSSTGSFPTVAAQNEPQREPGRAYAMSERISRPTSPINPRSESPIQRPMSPGRLFEIPPQEKVVVAISTPSPVSPRLYEHFELRPSRKEKKTEASKRIDRSDWTMKVMRRNPELSNLRDRLQPLHRAISFCELYNRGRGKTPISNEVILQLIMQYFDHEGLRGALKTLEKESDTPFQFRASDDFQLQDPRLISLLMISVNDIEAIWDIAMGERSSSRLFQAETEQFDARPTEIVQSDEQRIEKNYKMNLESLNEILTSLRLREEDQLGFGAFANSMNVKSSLSANEDINIWQDTSNTSLVVDPTSGQIIAGSLNKLVEILTPSAAVDLHYVQAFLVTYQLFSSSSALLSKLVQRYNVPEGIARTVEEHKKIVVPIQIRVLNVIKRWIEEFYSDFDDGIISNIRDFCNFQVRNTHPQLAENILSLLDKQNTPAGDPAYKSKIIEFSFSTNPPRPIVPKNIFNPSLSWDDVDDEEIARQLTLIEYEGFYKIRTSELLHQSWNKPKYKHRSPHVLAMINRFNMVSEWVGTVIIQCTRLRQRVKIFSKLVGIADHLRQLQNWNTLMAFIAMFNSASIHRLKHTIAEMSPKTQETLSELKRLMKADDGYANYRSMLEASLPPCIPYLGLYLTELTHAEDGSSTILPGGLINFAKCRLISSIISHINVYQQKGYNLQGVYQIQTLLRDLSPRMTDKEIFKQSLVIEPRGAERTQLVQ